MSKQPEDADRLSHIATMWTMVRQAHGAEKDTSREAQRILMDRYCAAVHRYLVGALRDEEAAGELFQEFALRFLRGDFRRTEAGRGRFRDYVRTVLINLVNDHHRSRGRQEALVADVAAPIAGEDDVAFVDSWRTELMNHAWAAMEKTRPLYHAVLLRYVETPGVESGEVAEELSAKLRKPMTSTNVRVTLHRAREWFAELLLGEVVRSLESPSDEELAAELAALKLTGVCKAAIEKHLGKRS